VKYETSPQRVVPKRTDAASALDSYVHAEQQSGRWVDAPPAHMVQRARAVARCVCVEVGHFPMALNVVVCARCADVIACERCSGSGRVADDPDNYKNPVWSACTECGGTGGLR
jgi:hypothetical protein